MSSTSEDADWINPIMVRYFRACFRSRFLVGGFMCLLFLMVCFVLLVVATSSESQNAARQTAEMMYLFMVIPSLFIPFMAMRAMNQEQSRNTLELLIVTGIGGKRFAWGGWLTFFSIIALWQAILSPIWVLFYFTHGEDIVSSLLASAMVLVSTAPFIMAGLWVGVLTNVFKRLGAMIIWLIGYGFTLGMFMAIMGAIVSSASGTLGEFGALVIYIIHSAFATWLSRNMVESQLSWETQKDSLYVVEVPAQ